MAEEESQKKEIYNYDAPWVSAACSLCILPFSAPFSGAGRASDLASIHSRRARLIAWLWCACCALQTIYAMGWCNRPGDRFRFRMALGSFVEEYGNKIQVRRVCTTESSCGLL